MSTMQLGLSIALAAIVTVASRFIAFILFPTGRKVPDFIHWLSDKLPRMTMIMLVIYCLKDVSFTGGPVAWLPALGGVAVTSVVHLRYKNMMLSIAGGTAFYMLMLRLL